MTKLILKEAVSDFTQLTHITVKNAGHNLYMSSPEIHTRMLDFLHDKPVSEKSIVIALPKFFGKKISSR